MIPNIESLTLYQQLKNHLESLIRSGELQAGDRLPSEKELEVQFKVSRITVRRALQELAVEEKILRIPGKGSFVLKPKIQPLTALTSFSENMRAQGFEPSYKNCQVKLVKAPLKVAAFFDTYQDDRALSIKRLMLANGIPMAIQDAYLPAAIYEANPHWFTPEVLNVISMYATLEMQLGIKLARAEEYVDVAQANASDAEQLEIKRGDLIMVITRMSYSENNRPIEYVRLTFRADRYRYRVELFRPTRKSFLP